jgi:hypothetical protein
VDDPYRTRTLPDGTQLPVRRLVYGRNLGEMRVKREFTKNAPANISVRAYNTEQKQVLVERFPLAADKQVYALPGNASPDQKWLEITVEGGVNDRKTLRAYAQEYYENLSRQEIGYELKTINFASFGGGNDDPDLLDLKAGDPIEVLISRDDFYSSLTDLERQLTSVQLNAKLMQDAGFSAEFANAYAKAYTDAGFQTLYRTHTMEVQGDTEQGVSLSIHVVNYVEVTSDKSLAAGEEPAATSPNAPPAPPGSPPPNPGPAPTTGG